MFKLSMPPLPIGTTDVLFDISRLYRNRKNRFGTGVDRIDLAIGLNLLSQFGNRCHFLHAGKFGSKILPHRLGAGILTHLDAAWNFGGGRELESLTIGERLSRLLFPVRREHIANTHMTYIVASHSGLGKVAGAMRRLDPRKSMRRVVYLHDIIPLEMPEYQRPETKKAFEDYLAELTDAPLTVVSNSFDTDRRVRQLAERQDWPVEDFLVRTPSLERLSIPERPPRTEVRDFLAGSQPFFTIVGTIEPRKNHLLLLNLWRQLASEGIDMPRLCIVGRRGWENENILDMLDRCEPIKASVQEFGSLDDFEVQALIQKSKALLLPSFIEGLGIPLLEAAALGVPCIVSDIPAHREIAPPDTIFLDPLDGPGWKRAISAKMAAS